jgi:hypothetical protein
MYIYPNLLDRDTPFSLWGSSTAHMRFDNGVVASDLLGCLVTFMLGFRAVVEGAKVQQLDRRPKVPVHLQRTPPGGLQLLLDIFSVSTLEEGESREVGADTNRCEDELVESNTGDNLHVRILLDDDKLVEDLVPAGSCGTEDTLTMTCQRVLRMRWDEETYSHRKPRSLQLPKGRGS